MPTDPALASDSIPTDEDERVYQKILTNDDGSCACPKVGIETARHRRKIREHDARFDRYDRFLYGDPSNPTWPGAQIIMESMHQHVTGNATTAIVRKKKADFGESFMLVARFVMWVLTAAAAFATAISAIVMMVKS